MALPNGTRLGPYEIVGWLGAGGMGDVYRARDPRLEREVAIKLIQDAFATDAGRVRRLEAEARAAGQLNHPNILAVHDVGLHDRAPYIVTELVEGESLRSRLHQGALPTRKAIDYARQIAEGLAAAHEKHVVHRDVKPDNLFVTRDDRVKLLDFGIARLTRPTDDAIPVNSSTETAAGMVVGTARYMSPEQVRGESIDGRSDLFSIGTILYEMLTGRPAFARATAAETMAAVLNDDVPEPLMSEVPPALARIVARCLEKRRDTRFQSARDLAFALECLSSGTTPVPQRAPAAAPGWRPVVVTVAVLAGILAATAAWRSGRAPVIDPLAAARVTRFTDWEGTEALAEISPDGRFVAFLADREGQYDIWLSQVGTGEFRNLTADLPPMNPPGIVLRPFGFSGDGSRIWFSVSGNPGDRKMLMPLMGGKAWPFLGEGDITPSWAPDGARVAYVNNRDGDPLFVADGTGADARQVLAATPGVLHNHDPVWSRDGQRLYFVRGLEPTDVMDIWRLDPASAALERLTDQRGTINFLAPIDSRTLLYVARAQDRSGPWLWALDVDSRVTRRVSWGLEQYTSVAASRDGRRVVATIANPSGSLWMVPILDRPAEERDVQASPTTTVRAAGPRFGGTSLFYLSAAGTGNGLWRFADGQASEVWRGADGALSEPPAISPGGERMAVVVSRAGTRRLTIMSTDGTNARTLATAVDIQGAAGQTAADWSADGTSLIAGGSDAEGAGLFRLPVDGGQAVRLTSGQATNPVRSPDGRLIVYAGAFVGGRAPLRAIRPDGTPVALPDVTVRQGGYRFLPDGSGLVYLPDLQARDFRLLDFRSGTSRPLTRLTNQGALGTFDISPDGTQIVFDRSRANADVVLIDLPARAGPD